MWVNQHFTLTPAHEADQDQPAMHSCGRWDTFDSVHVTFWLSEKSWVSILCVLAYTVLSRFRRMTWVVYFILHSHPFIANFVRMLSLTVYIEQLLVSSRENMMTAALPLHLPLLTLLTFYSYFLVRSDLCLWHCMRSQLRHFGGFHSSGNHWKHGSWQKDKSIRITQSCVHARR